MNVLGTTLIQVLLLSGSLLAEENHENTVDDDDPENFPERLRSAMLRSTWQSEPIPVVPLPQGVENQEGNHPQPGIPPPPPADNDDNSEDSQPPPPPPIPPPPTAEETTTEPDANVGGNYWYYSETPQTEPSTAANNWWSYTTRQPFVETTTQPSNNIWYNYYTTRKPTTFSWINWNSFTLSPTTMKYYWQAPAAGSPGSHQDSTGTDSTFHQNLETVPTEKSPNSATSILKPTVSQQNILYNSHTNFTRPSQDSWQFWDNLSKSTAKYLWYSSGDVPLSSTEHPWKYISASINTSSRINDTHNLNAMSSKITSNVPESSTIRPASETVYSVSTNRTSEFSPEITIRPQSTWLESKLNITHTPLNTRHIWNVISGSQPNVRYYWYATNDNSSDRTIKLHEILPDGLKNDETDSRISGTSFGKANYSVISYGRETATSDENRLRDSSNETNKSEQHPYKYFYNIGASPRTVKNDKKTSIYHKVSTDTQKVDRSLSNVPKQSSQINANVTRYSLKPWTFWENSVKLKPNFRYYWYAPEHDSLKVQLKSSEMSLGQTSKQEANTEDTVSSLENISSAKSKASVGLKYSDWRESKIESTSPYWKYWDSLNEQPIAEKLKYANTDGSSENIKVPAATSPKSYSEFQNKISVSATSEPEMTNRPQYIGPDSKLNKIHNSPVSWYFSNSTSNSQPKGSYKWYSTGDAFTRGTKYDKSSDLVERHYSISGQLSTLPPQERVSVSTRKETEIKSQYRPETQFIKNNTSNPQTKFKYFWYGKDNGANEVPVKHNDKYTLISAANDTILTLGKFNSVDSERDKSAHHQDNYDSTLDTTKSPVGRWKYWYTSGNYPESYKYIWESSNGKTLNLSTERSKTSIELEKGIFSTVTPKSESLNTVSAKEEKSQFNNLWLNSELTSGGSPHPSERSKSQPAFRYYWYSPDDESHNVNVKSFATSDGLVKNSSKYIIQPKNTNIFETLYEEHKILQQKHGSYDSKIESTSYSPITSKYFTSSDSQSSDQYDASSSADPTISPIYEDVNSVPALSNSEVTVRPLSTWFYSKSNSSHISFKSRNNTSKPQIKYYWYGVDEVTRKLPLEAHDRSTANETEATSFTSSSKAWPL